MIKIYTYDHNRWFPVVVETECKVFGYPNRDVKGEIQYSNTHFKTREEAYKELTSNTRFHYLKWGIEDIINDIKALRMSLYRLIKEIIGIIYVRTVGRFVIYINK